MKHETDYGTPETIAHLAASAGLKRAGLKYLYQRRTIDHDQYRAGIIYAAAWQARYGHLSPQSSLGNLTSSEGAPADPASEYWLKLMSKIDGASLHMKISAELAVKSFYARGKSLHTIIEHVAGHDTWGVDEVADFCQLERKAASRRVGEAFDALIKAVEIVEKELEKVS